LRFGQLESRNSPNTHARKRGQTSHGSVDVLTALALTHPQVTLPAPGYDITSEEYRDHLSKIHKMAAERLLALCQLHGGVWNKFGQFIASLVKILPDEYTDTLK
jgi:predicted unusual protein kinase regulating ubiquinone biosynthesis (AarF/ABC1/UbiB family)